MPSTTTLIPEAGTLLIDGTWRAGSTRFNVIDPATLEVIGQADEASAADALEAMDAAVKGFVAWSATDAETRATVLQAGAARIRANADALAELMSLENGKPLAEAKGEVISSARMLAWAAEEGRRANGRVTPPGANGPGLVLTSAVGPVLAITPWNFPGSMLVRKVGLALAAGCSIIVKPAEQTPLIGVALIGLIAEGLPAGALQLLSTSKPGETVAPLLADARLRKISFTGSTEVGLHLVRSTGRNLRRMSLEMGGHSPAIVLEDADIDATATALVACKFANGGQSCISINRLFVHASIHDALVTKVAEKAAALTVGHGIAEGTKIGPLIDLDALDKVERHVEDAVKRGATVVTGGQRWTGTADLKGAFFEPTVLSGVDETMQVATEETFGPVLPILTFDDDDDVVRRANDTEYGLAAYVFGRDLSRTLSIVSALDFGVIGLNDPFPVRPELPFGGMKNSGQEREGGSEGINAYLETKSVAIKL